MSILTGVIIVVSMAVLAQRSDSLISFFTRETPPMVAPQNDEAVVIAGGGEVIDVLANDENLLPEDRDNVRIVVSPSCGAAEATDRGVLYISNNLCVGPQLFAYCVARGDDCPSASVTVLVTDDPAFSPQREAEVPVAAVRPRPARDASESARTEIAAAPRAARLGDTALAPQRAERTATNTDAGVAPRVSGAAAARASGDLIDSPRALGGDAVAAAVRPIAPSQMTIGTLAPPPRLDTSGLVEDSATAPETFESASLAPAGDVATGQGAADAAAGAIRGTTEPDVSAIRLPQGAAAETPPTEIATLSLEPDADTLAAVREQAASDLLAAARADRVAEPASEDGFADRTPPADGGCGPAMIASKAGSGGSSVVEVSSRCRAGDLFEIAHFDLRFSGRLDAGGQARIVIPVMDESGAAEIVFEDGAAFPHELKFNWRELETTRRVAVAWTDDVDIDLHAFEYAAEFGGEGHVWQERPRGFRLVRRSGGGYLDSYPAAYRGGQSIEVYTFWANRRARRGVARIALDHASRGAAPSGDFCGDGALASPEYMVVRSERGVVTSRARGRFASAACGAELSGDARYASGALRDLRIE